MDRDLAHAYPPLATAVTLILADYHEAHPVSICKPIGVWRSDAEQIALYAQGRTTPGPGASPEHPLGHTVTEKDGVKEKSKHQGLDPNGRPCSLAVDLGVFIDGKYMASEIYYREFQDLAHRHGLRSGWDFPTLFGGHFVDPPHLEWIGNPDFSYLSYPTSDSTAVGGKDG